MKSCQRCGKCCRAHPCAISPEDLPRIAARLGLLDEQLFKKYLVIDYTQEFDTRRYYLCPARSGDVPGRIVPSSWTFSDSPCVFLKSDNCLIEKVKPKGGRTLSCSLMTLGTNQIEYGKAKAVLDWNNSHFLKQMMPEADDSVIS